jgi:predicted Zn-dependent protease with MMP-like domain
MQTSRQEIIMNFSTPPSAEDILVLANNCIEILPDMFADFCKNLECAVEDFIDEDLEAQLESDDPYEVLIFLKSGREISPGIEIKNSDEKDILTLFRRAIIDYWAETEDDLADLISRIIFEEIAAEHDYTADEIAEMVQTHLDH